MFLCIHLKNRNVNRNVMKEKKVRENTWKREGDVDRERQRRRTHQCGAEDTERAFSSEVHRGAIDARIVPSSALPTLVSGSMAVSHNEQFGNE